MTIKQYQNKLDKRIREVDFDNKLIAQCVATAHKNYVNRIFVSGRRSNGSKIGTYSSESYKKKRKARGRQTSTVDFTFEGRLGTNVRNSLRRVTDKIMVNGATTDFEAKKIDWLTDMYGEDVWMIGKRNLDTLRKCVARQTLKILTK